MRTTTILAGIAAIGALVGCAPNEQPDPTPTDPVEAAEFGRSEAQEAAQPYVGLDEAAALELAAEQNVEARVGTVADVGEPGQTDDYELGRLTFVVVNGVVAEVVVETATGPVTVAAG